jgi:Tetratricopeptide repeat.
MALEKDLENGPKKLQLLRRSSQKTDKSDSNIGYYNSSAKLGDITSTDKRKAYQYSPKAMQGTSQGVNPFVAYDSKEEDFLNPEAQNNNYLHIDNSQFMTNDLRGNSFANGMNSTTRSFFKNGHDDTISVSSDVSFQETGNSTLKPKERRSDFSEVGDTLRSSLQSFKGDSKDLKAKAEWYHAQGFEARKRGDFLLAIEYYTKALELVPNHFKVIFPDKFVIY